MAELREVRIPIGKRNYRMQTALDEPTLDRVVSIVSDVSSSAGDNVDQDQLLMLTCLQLAYSLEKISQRLEKLTDRLRETERMKNGDE
ncbi:MAG: cell division protein ZapA [Synergistaceae bacterium]|nr:cell division protein ZapA [Synergistaceae bacterium]